MNTNYYNQTPSTGVLTNPNYVNWYNQSIPQNNYQFSFTNPELYNSNQLGILTNPSKGGIGGAWGNMGLGDKLGTVFGGLQTLGSLYGSIKQIGLAEKQLDQQREQWNKTWGMAVNQHNEGVSTRAANKYNQNRDYAAKEYKRNKVDK